MSKTIQGYGIHTLLMGLVKQHFLNSHCKIICPDSYRVGEPDYDGVFHCRLWSLGAWHDVYIDDLLPVSRVTGKLWGAYSATDDNEMWVALIEKAFARSVHEMYSPVIIMQSSTFSIARVPGAGERWAGAGKS